MPSGVESLAALHRSWAVSRCLAEALSEPERPGVAFLELCRCVEQSSEQS